MVTIYYGKGGKYLYTVGFPGGYFTVYPGKPKLNGVTYTSRISRPHSKWRVIGTALELTGIGFIQKTCDLPIIDTLWDEEEVFDLSELRHPLRKR